MKALREVLLVLLGISPAIGALVLYSQLPDTMATHFGIHNEVNGTMNKGKFIIVLIVLGLVPVILRVARKIDPKRANYEQFSTAFAVSRIGVTLLLTAVGWMSIAYNLGIHVNMTKVVLCVVGLFFIIMGNYLTQVKPNYMFGIRTPWTLANEEIWRKTHRLAGPLMMLGGLISLILSFMSGSAIGIVIIAVLIIVAIIPVIYSYVLYIRNKVQ